jgi:hypothetical protein
MGAISVKALSILQPWAWLIVNGHKDIENRGWHTPYRGKFLVHAGKKYGPRIHEEDAGFFLEADGIQLPPFEQMQIGGIVGEATIIDCKRDIASRWYVDGSWGFVLTGMRALPFRPYRGQLGFFDIPALDILPR